MWVAVEVSSEDLLTLSKNEVEGEEALYDEALGRVIRSLIDASQTYDGEQGYIMVFNGGRNE
jgi:hypothetical protein